MSELLGGSLFFIYLFSVVTVMNYSRLDNRQKISVIYILTYGIEFNRSSIEESSRADSWILYIAFLCAIFLFEEYWNDDKYKSKLIKGIVYKAMDYLYQFIFVYKGLLFSAAYVVLAKADEIGGKIDLCEGDIAGKIVIAVSALILVGAIHSVFAWPVEHFSYTEIMNKIEEWPYYKMVEEEKDTAQFRERLELVTDIEDRFFFQRKSYTFFSAGYVKLYLQDGEKGGHFSGTAAFERFKMEWKCNRGIRAKMRLVGKCLKKIFRYLGNWIARKKKKAGKFRKAVFRRGHSTIEMQLFRTLSYKRGIKVGKPHGIRETCNALVRKGYEIFFTHIFFSGLKKYLQESGIANMKRYREYIVYLYVHTVIAWYNGKRYMPMSNLFKGEKVSKWNLEKLFIEALGLSQKSKIEMERVLRFGSIMEKYHLDRKKIEKILRGHG